MRFEIMGEKDRSSQKNPKEMSKKELNSKVDEIIEKNFEDFKSQDEIEDFIQRAFNDKASKFNEKLELKEKELNKQIKNANKNDTKRIDRKMKEMDKKIKLHYKSLAN